MTPNYPTPWHKQSFDHFLYERLPELLASRLPLAGYAAQPSGPGACQVTVDLQSGGGVVSLIYAALPQPDEQGLFQLDGRRLVVIPIASQEELDRAEVDSAGEQLYSYIAARLGQAPGGVALDESLARALLPLEAWFEGFLRETGQVLDDTNWHSIQTHLRRVLIPSRKRVAAPGQMGRVDPFETPEGPMIGKVFTVALGAEIRERRLVITDARPTHALGPNAACIPFLEHDDPNRLLMGDNMMRQGLVPPKAEPALVQTGFEPPDAGPDLWCGRNLLTAFVTWGEGSVEDGLIISQSCARRLNYPYPAEPGDKLSNRHGTKGVVSQVLPDDQMPHLADGTPVEMAYSFTGLAVRMNIGQELEAVMGRAARAEGQPAVVPPFGAPKADEIRARLAAAGLPESGMEHLRAGKDGPEMPYASTVGYVYWYRLAHLARPKLRAAGLAEIAPDPIFAGYDEMRVLGELELNVLRQAGALANAREAVLGRSDQPVDAPGTPYLRSLQTRLAAAGIRAELREGQLAFAFQPPQEEGALRLPRALPHPWLNEQAIERAGAPPAGASAAARRAYQTLAQSADRLSRWLAVMSPTRARLDAPAAAEEGQSPHLDTLVLQVGKNLWEYFEALLPAEALRFSERQSFAGQAVIAPGVGLRLDQIGVPESIARALFGEAPAEEIERSWVIAHRAPAVTPTALLAFHPVVTADPVIRLHPQACDLLNADFDGDQIALYRPLSAEAQAEAGERLSMAAHLRRSPDILQALRPKHEGIWGLAYLSLEQEGRRQIAQLLNVAEDRIPAPLNETQVVALLREVLEREGVDETLRVVNALAHLGYAAASASGASFSPFARSQVALPPPPEGEDEAEWAAYQEACSEALLSGRGYREDNLGPQLLSTAARARSRRLLPWLMCPHGPVTSAEGRKVYMRHTLLEGRTPEEQFAITAPAREGLARLATEGEKILSESGASGTAFTVLARARRSKRPGLVFARAAASGEVDPLTDEESRLLVGR